MPEHAGHFFCYLRGFLLITARIFPQPAIELIFYRFVKDECSAITNNQSDLFTCPET
jgi:hypothetical protein